MAIARHKVLNGVVKSIIYDADSNFREYRKAQGISARDNLTATAEQQLDPQQIRGLLLDEASRLACSMFDLPNMAHIRFTKLTNLRLVGSIQDLPEPSTLTVADLPEDLRGYGIRSFLTLMRAASLAASPIRTLEISNRLHGLHCSFLNLQGIDMHHLLAVFTHLTSISLYLNTNEGERDSEDALQEGNLSKLLMSSTHLQQLSLSFDQRPDERVRLVQILSSGVWKALRRLNIMAIDFHLWEITNFVQRHQNLNHIGLANCRLYSGSLRQLLELLKDELPQLETLNLSGALGDSKMEFDFLEPSENRRTGTKFVIGGGDYPTFNVTELEDG